LAGRQSNREKTDARKGKDKYWKSKQTYYYAGYCEVQRTHSCAYMFEINPDPLTLFSWPRAGLGDVTFLYRKANSEIVVPGVVYVMCGLVFLFFIVALQ